MHQHMHRPMHGPACPSTPTQIPWLVTCRTWEYTILLLCITKRSIQTQENLERLKLKKLVVFLETKDCYFIPFLFRGQLTKKCALLFGSFFSWSISFDEMWNVFKEQEKCWLKEAVRENTVSNLYSSVFGHSVSMIYGRFSIRSCSSLRLGSQMSRLRQLTR